MAECGDLMKADATNTLVVRIFMRVKNDVPFVEFSDSDRLTSGQGQNQTNNPSMTGGVELKCRDDLAQRERGVQ